jgi:hypothetical protein
LSSTPALVDSEASRSSSAARSASREKGSGASSRSLSAYRCSPISASSRCREIARSVVRVAERSALLERRDELAARLCEFGLRCAAERDQHDAAAKTLRAIHA